MDLYRYIMSIGYVPDIAPQNLSSFVSERLTTVLRKEGAPDITWGLHVAGHPPMLIHPMPAFVVNRGGDVCVYMDAEAFLKYQGRFSGEQIYLSMIRKTYLQVNE